jgi:hypothetical protein
VVEKGLRGADIAKAREVPDSVNPAAEQRCGEDGERRVLGAADPHLPLEGPTPFDEDLIHGITSVTNHPAGWVGRFGALEHSNFGFLELPVPPDRQSPLGSHQESSCFEREYYLDYFVSATRTLSMAL